MGGNQYKPDPRQTLFLQYFLDKDSETFSNAYQSALRAGYSQEYAENITHLMPDWLSESIGDKAIVDQAEKNLKEFLSDDEEDKKIKADMTKFTLKTLKKEKYSERSELTGAGGQPVLVLPSELIKKNDINTSPETNSQ